MADQHLIDFFLEVIQIEALSGEEKNLAEFISHYLRALSLSPREDDAAKATGGNTGNIICPIGTGGDYLLLSHMDTARSTKGVKPVIHSDRITSDTTTVLGVDNRVGVACILYALQKARRENIPLADCTVVFTTHEETTLGGSLNLGVNGSIRRGFVLDSHLRPGNFIRESVGAIDFTINIKGKAAHSGLAPEKGINAIAIAADALSRVKFGRIDEETTANIGTIQGGTAVNVVAESAKVVGEVRSITPSKIDAKIEEITSAFSRAAGNAAGQVEFRLDWGFKPYRITQDQEVYQAVESALRNVGLSPIPNTSWGGSDANSLNGRGIQTINLGIGAANPHSNEEYILLEDLQKTADIALELMRAK